MKKNLLLLPFIALLVYVVLSGNASGPGSMSGVDATTGGCSCHNTLASPATVVSLQLLSSGTPVSSYAPGGSYTIRLSGTQTNGALTLPRFGFQVSATNSGGFTTGALTAPIGTHTVSPAGVVLVEHSSAIAATTGTGGAGTTYVIDIPWTAPTSGTGTVTLRGVLNAVNFNGTFDGGDQWNNTSLAVTEASSVPTITALSSLVANPGSPITITGTNFNTTAGNNIVYFGATKGTVTSASASSLSVTVPAGGIYRPVSVLNTASSLAASSQYPFLPGYNNTAYITATANFNTKVDFATTGGVEGVAAGDIDGDGKAEIIAINPSYNAISVFRNTSTSGSISLSSFAAKVDFATGSNPRKVVVADVDGDGKLDVVVTNGSSNSVSVFRNTATSGTISSSSFATKVDFTTGFAPAGLAVDDVDGDGKPEIIALNSSSGTFSVFRNTSTSGSITSGSFAAKVDFTSLTNSPNLAVGDIDGDGKKDIVTTTTSSNQISLFRNTATAGSITAASFASGVTFTTASTPTDVIVADIDGDGKPEVVCSNNGSSSVSVFRNTATSGVINTSSLAAKVDFTTGTQPHGLAIGDVNGDGKPDVFVANNGGSPYKVSVLRNTATSGSISSSSFAGKSDFIVYDQPKYLVVCDFDGDDKPDVCASNAGLAFISVLHNEPVYVPVTVSGIAPTSGNTGASVTITGSGFNSSAANNIVYFGATKATVSSASATSLDVSAPGGATYSPVSILNTAIASQAASTYPFLPTYNNSAYIPGVLDFNAKVDFAANLCYNPVIADMDGDGKADVLVPRASSAGNGVVSVFRNTGTSGSFTTGSLASPVTFSGPALTVNGVAVGDVDGDGKPDMVITSSAGLFSVFRNTSTAGSITSGSFATRIDFGVAASGSSRATLADIDMDGKLDVIVVSNTTMYVFRNTSTAGVISTSSFADGVGFALGTSVTSKDIAIGDLDGDGKPDIVVAIASSNKFTIFRNTCTPGTINTGSLATSVDITSLGYPSEFALADIDADGKLDIVVSLNTLNKIAVFRNIATAGSITASSFASSFDFTTPSGPLDISAADFNGDGKPDIAVACSTGVVAVFRNTEVSGAVSGGAFASYVSFSVPSAEGVITGDLDGDGKPDIASTTNSNLLSVLRNNPPLAPPTITSVSPNVGIPGTSVTITGTNFNATTANNIVYFGATKATVTSASTTSLGVTVPYGSIYKPVSVNNTALSATANAKYPFLPTYDNSPYIAASVNFSPKADFTAGTTTYGIAVVDIDGDGKSDLVTANAGSNNISVYRNISSTGSLTTGSFAAKVDFITSSSPRRIAVADFDGDGKPDLAVTNFTSNTMSVFRNTATSGVINTLSFASRFDFTTGSGPEGITAADFDFDGKIDIAVANSSSGSVVSVFRNTSSTGTVSFATKVDFTALTTPYSISSGDADGDGKPDLVVGATGSSQLAVLRNTASFGAITSGSFATAVTFSSSSNLAADIALTDIDGDGKPELVANNNVANTLSVLRNTATSGTITAGSFAAKVDFVTGTQPTGMAIGDINGDGKADVITSNSGTGNVSVLRNAATSGSITTSSFAAKVDFAAAGTPKMIAVGDLDGDGKADIATANGTATSMSIMRNTPLSLIAGPTIICEGNSITLTDSASGGTWTSSNSTVAVVGISSGIVSGLTAGTATITYTAPGGITTTVVSVNAAPAAITGTLSLCAGATTSLSNSTSGGTWSSGNPSVATITSTSGVVTGILAGTATISYTIGSGCRVTAVVTVSQPSVTVAPASASICLGGSSSHTVSVATSLLLQDFNSGLGAWTITNISGTPASYWQIKTSTASGAVGDGTPMLEADADATPTPTNTILVSPPFSTIGVGAATLTFNQYLISIASADANVDVDYSVDGGATWTMLLSQVGIVSGSGAWTASTPEVSITLPAATLGQPNLRLRWKYNSNYGLYWDIDNIKVAGSAGASTYGWTGPSGSTGISCATCGTTSLTPTATGTSVYTVTAAYAGCSGSATVAVTANPMTAITGTLGFCTGGITSLSNTSAGGTWSSSNPVVATIGSATGVATGVSAGTSTITYTLSSGCYSTAIVTVYSVPAAITGTLALCEGSTTTLSNSTTGGTWSSSSPLIASVGSSTGVVTGNAAGVATISYSLGTGCMVTAAVTINALPAAITGVLGFCDGTATTLSDLTIAGVWSSSNLVVATVGATTGVAAGVGSGTSTISYTLSTGCRATAVVTVFPNPGAITGTATVCVGATTTLGNSVSGGTWTSNNPGIASVSASGVVSGVTAGTTRISYVLSTGCYAFRDVTVNATPAAITGPASLCISSTITLADATPGGVWSTSDVTVATVAMTTGVVTGVSQGVTDITYNIGGCYATRFVTVNAPTSFSVTGGGNYCSGGSGVTVDLSGSATGTSYQLYRGSTLVGSSVSGTGAAISFGLQTAAGTYTVLATNITSGCTGAMAGSVTVATNALPTAFAVTGGGSYCSGGSGVPVDVANSTGGTIYQLYLGATAVGSPIAGTGSAVSFGLQTAVGTYTVLAVNAATACAAGMSGSATVSIISAPAAITGAFSVCVGSTTSLADPSGGGTWSSSSTLVATVSSTSGVVMGVTPGTVTITYTLSGGCFVTQVVTVNPAPAAITGIPNICVGVTTTLADATSGGLWSSSNTSVASIGSTTGLLSGVSAGTATVTYMIGTGCMVTQNVTVYGAPSVFNVTGGGSYCAGGSGVTVGLNGSLPGTNYLLYRGATLVGSAIAGTGSSLSFGLQTVVGTYTVLATNISSCTAAMSGSATVSITSPPAATTGSFTTCVGSVTTLADATSGGTWSSSSVGVATVGSASGIVTGVTAGTATITYLPSGGCSATQIVTVNGLPGAGTITGPITVSVGSAITLADATPGWATKAAMPGPRHSPEALAAIGNNIYFFGGASAAGPQNSTFAYNILADSWTTLTGMPGARYAGDGAGVISNKIYVPGGWTTSPPLPNNNLYIYNTLTDSWTTGPSMPSLSAQGITGVINNKLYVTSAANGSGGYTRSLYLYDTSAGWSSLANSPIAHESPGGGVINGKLYIVGGYNDAGTVITSQLDVYDPSSNTWVTKASAPAPIHGPASAVVNGKLYLAGNNDGSTVQDVVYVYDPVSDAWATQTSLPVPMQVAGGIGVNGNMYVMGGLGSSSLNTAYAFTPSSWNSSTPSVASVSQSGIVAGITPGTTTVSYTVTSGVTGCSSSATVVITSSVVLSPITGTTVVCAGNTTTLTDSTSGGTWSSSNTSVATIGSLSGVVTGIAGGTATISYTVSGSSVTTVVTVNTAPNAGTITGASSVCAGSTITLSDAVSGGSWTSSMLSVATVDGSGVVTGNIAGTVTISYTVFGACGTATATKAITVNPAPNAGSITGSTTVCAGSAISLSTSGSGGSWSSSAPTIASVNASGVVSGLAAGSVTISYSVTNSCGTVAATQTIFVNPLPNAGAITGASSVCAGSTITLSDAVSGGSWITSMPSVATVDASGVVTGSIAGTVTITYTVTSSCGTAIATKILTVNALPTTNPITGSSAVCVGAAITLATTPSGGTWSSGDIATATVGTSGVVSGTAAGVATISYTITNGCGSAVATKVVTVNALPNAGGITGASTVCVGSAITLSSTVSGGSWTSSAPTIASVNASGVVSGLAAAAATITYTVTNGCGTAVATKGITVNPMPSAGTLSGSTTVCAGSSITLSSTISGGSWASSNTSVASVGTSGIVTGLAAGTTTITYMVTNSCGTGTATKTVTVNPLPNAGAITGATTVCVASAVTLSTSGSGGAWSSSNTSRATVNTLGVVSGVSAGTVTISYVATNSCGTSIATSVVTVNALPSAGTITGSATVCVGASVTLSDAVSGGSWSSSMPSVATVNASGVVNGSIAGAAIISYTVTNSCGIANATKSITVNPLPNPGTITGASSVNVGATISLSNSVSGGTWSSGATALATVSAAGVVTGVSAGMVIISYTATNSCGSAFDTMMITVNAVPVAITGTRTVCVGRTTTLSNTNAGGSWFSSNTAVATIDVATGIVSGLAAGTSTISYVHAVGTVTAVVTVNPTPAAISGSATVCVGLTTTFSTTPTGGAWSSSTTGVASITTAGVATGVTVGTTTISYTLSTGCANSVVLTVNAAPSVSGTLSVCTGAATSLTGSPAGGAWASSNVAVASVDASGTVSGLTAGTSVITYTLATGCRTTRVVTVSTLPTAGAISGPSAVTVGATITLTNTVSGGTWSAGSGNATISAGGVVTGVAAGFVTISYTKTNSCGTAIATVNITVNAAPITGTAVVCAGSSTSLSHVVTGGTWSSGNIAVATVGLTNGVVTGVSAGMADITYTYSGGVAVKTVTVNAAPSVGLITGTTSVCSGTTSTLSNSTTGGVWSSSTPTVASVVSATGVVTGIALGTARITYTVSSSCGTAIAITTVTVSSSASAGTITGTATLCAGGTTTLSSSVGGGVWNSSNASTATIGSASGIVNGVAAGTATISYTVTNSCGTAMATKVVTVNGAPAPGTINGTATVCVGSTRTLTAAVTGGVWSSGDMSLGTIGAANGIVAGVSPGIVPISYAVSNTCGTSYATRAVTVNAAPGISPITGTLTLCTSGTTTLANATTGGTWSSSASSIAAVGLSNGVVTGAASGTATISYVYNTTCGTAIATAEVTVNAVSGGVISGAASVCMGATTTFGHPVSGGTWTSSNSSIAAVGSATGLVYGAATGVATISYTTMDVCGALVATKAITVNTVPTPGTITGTATTCVGSSTALSNSVTGGVWLSGDASIATIGSSTGVVSGLSGGVVAISYAVPNGCGTSFAARMVTVNPAPGVGAIAGPSTACIGSTITLTNTATGGAWSSSNASVATISSSGGVVSAISAGTTAITYTLSGSCGSANAITIITVQLVPVIGSITGTGTICAGSSLTLANSVSGGTWSSGNAAIASVDATSGEVTGVSAGAATITYSVTNSCGTATATAVVSVDVTAVAGTISGASNICPGTSSTMASTVSGGVWSSDNTSVATVSSTSGTVNGLIPGVATISYSVTNTCGTVAATTIVTVSASPSAGTITGSSSACSGTTLTLANAVGGGVWSSSDASVAAISTSGVVNALASGTTVISYTVATSCGTSVATFPLTVNPSPDAGSISGPSVVGLGSSVAFSTSGSGGTWSMSNGNATITAGGVVTGVALGNDTAYYTVTNGCGTDIASKAITVSFTVDPLTGTLSVCVGSSTVLSSTTPGGVWSASAPAVASVSPAGVVTGLAPGTSVISYTVTGVSATAVVTVLSAPSAITGTMAICEGAVTSLHNSSSGTWYSNDVSVATVGAATGYVSGLAAGTAGITFTTGNGCTASTIVTVNGLPDAITGLSNLCIGTSTTLSNSVAGGTWSSSNAGVAAVNSSTGVVSGVNIGTARITYTLPTSCRSIAIASVSALPAAITGTMVMCAGATAALSTTTTGGAWSSGDISIATVSATGLVTGISAGTAAITYTTSSGCFRSATVTVNPIPAAITGSANVCIGLTTTLASTTPGGTWSSNTGSVATINPSGVVTGWAAGTSTISYNVAGCRSTTVVTVSALPYTIAGTKKACPGTTTTLSNTTSGGTWSSNNILIATIDAITGVVTGVAAGTTDITYTTAAGCYRTATVTINANPAPIIGITIMCVGSSTSLSNSTSGGLSWSSSNSSVATVVSTGLVTGYSAGTAIITYTLGTGCFTIAGVTVTALPPAITGTTAVCAGNVTSLSNALPGGTWTSSNTSAATVDVAGAVTGIAYGTSAITYTLGTGCYRTATVTVNGLPGSITGYSTACVGTSTELSSTYGGTWISGNTSIATVGASSGVVTGVSAGTVDITYALTGTGCSRTQVVTVNPALTASTGTFSVCPGLTTTLSNALAGGTWTTQNTSIALVGSSSGVVTAVAAGNTNITYSFGTGCRAVTPITVKTLPAVISGPDSMCNLTTVNLTDVTPGGAWSSNNTAVATVGATNGIVYGVAGGTANITYTAPNTCYATTVMTVLPCTRPGNPAAAPELLNARLYPNPTSGTFTIETGQSGTFMLYTLDGKQLSSHDVKAGITEITMPHGLAAGVYMCRFNADNGGTLMVRLIYEP